MANKNLFKELTGIRVSDHYARNIYLEVFLKTAVPWILVTAHIPY